MEGLQARKHEKTTYKYTNFTYVSKVTWFDSKDVSVKPYLSFAYCSREASFKDHAAFLKRNYNFWNAKLCLLQNFS